MTGAGVLAGVNWNAHFCGREVDRFEFRTEIEANTPKRLLEPKTGSWTGWSVRLWWCRARRDDAE
jgi:hypothetical protein